MRPGSESVRDTHQLLIVRDIQEFWEEFSRLLSVMSKQKEVKGISLSVELWDKIDTNRGLIPRSAYVEQILKGAFLFSGKNLVTV